jgi:hypothetical protein
MLFQDLIRAHNFIGEDVGSSTILWNPTSNDGDYYVQGGQIHLKGETYISADDSIHEFGHNYMWSMNGGWTNTCPSTHYIYLGDDTQCAYKEGWADFLPLAVNENPIYHWADGSSLNIETLTLGPPDWDNGDTCEGRVAGAFWDIYDNVNDGYDEFQFPYSSIDTTVRQNTGFTFFDFWNTWKSSGYSSDAVWSIFQNTIDTQIRGPRLGFTRMVPGISIISVKVPGLLIPKLMDSEHPVLRMLSVTGMGMGRPK